jgi:hypothetical protein
MVKVIHKLEIVNQEGEQFYFLKVEITNDAGEHTYKTLTKLIPFNEFMKSVTMSDEEREIRAKAEEIMRKVLFDNMCRILQNEIVEEVDRITKMEEGLSQVASSSSIVGQLH